MIAGLIFSGIREEVVASLYLRCCYKAKVPTFGSSRLLIFSIWKQHSEIGEVKPTGHAIFDTCSAFHCERLSLEGLDGPEVKARRAHLNVEAEMHQAFHTTERDHYDDEVNEATRRPESMTTLTIDAPTQYQFDLPCQARWKPDTRDQEVGWHEPLAV